MTSKPPIKLLSRSRSRAIRDEAIWLRGFHARAGHSVVCLRLAVLRSQRITQHRRMAR